MNYLAHALLSQPGSLTLLGNLSGDHVKGRLEGLDLHPEILAGVARHRAVDAFSDSHAGSQALRARFPRGQRRYAGIFLDVLFDHLLSLHWERFCDTSLRDFHAEVYAAIREHAEALPPGFAALAPHWAAADWLSAYTSRDGTLAVLERLALRMRASMPLPELLNTADEHGHAIEAGFLSLFDDLLVGFGGTGRADLQLPTRQGE